MVEKIIVSNGDYMYGNGFDTMNFVLATNTHKRENITKEVKILLFLLS